MIGSIIGSAIKFQTKLTYGMICYNTAAGGRNNLGLFQTKLTYGMICYLELLGHHRVYLCFKLS